MLIMSRRFVSILTAIGIFFALGCEGGGAESRENLRAGCYPLGLGIDPPFCLISFNEAILRVPEEKDYVYQVRAILSKEFNDCVLHRDVFAAENYLDSESLAIDYEVCREVETKFLADRDYALIDVRGRLAPIQEGGLHRAGQFIEIVRIEDAHEPKRE